MTDPLELPLKVYRRVAAVTMLLPLALFVLTPIRHLLWLELALVWHWASIAWIDRRRGTWPPQRVVTAFCVAEWSAAVAITAVEGWALHITPIMCLGPVVLATQVAGAVRYRQLRLAAVGVIAGMSVLGRFTDSGPIRTSAGDKTVDVFAIVATPVLIGMVALLAWLNHGAVEQQRMLLAQSRLRLYRADESARASFVDFSNRMQDRIGDIGRRLRERDEHTTLETLNLDIQGVAAQIRAAAHSMGTPMGGLDDPEQLSRMVAENPWPTKVTAEPIGERDPVVDSVARAIITESFATARSPRSSSLILGEHEQCLSIAIDHAVTDSCDGRIEVGVLTKDRIDALDGIVLEPTEEDGHRKLHVHLPLQQSHTDRPSVAPREPHHDLLPPLVLPIASVVFTLIVWSTTLRRPELLEIAAQLVVLFALPCALAVGFASARPNTAIGLLVTSYWVTTITIVDQLKVLKWFAAIALLVPLLVALPHVRRAAFTALAIGTSAMTAATVLIARWTDELAVVDDIPEIVVDITVVAMITLCSTVVLHISSANYFAGAAAAIELARSRRRVVAAADAAQRRIERDLHDGTQQRLVSAALRTQIASRLDDANAVDENVKAASTELDRAASSLANLATGPGIAPARLGLALRQLASSSPLQVRLTIDDEPDDPSESVRTAIWFCCAEALANATKYAGESAHVEIDLNCSRTEVSFRVSDDGCGFHSVDGMGQGLQNMTERIEQVGGTLLIHSEVGDGTTIVGRIPR